MVTRAARLATPLIAVALVASGVVAVERRAAAHTQPSSTATERDALTALGPTPPDTIVDLTLRLRFPGAAALRRYVADQRASDWPTWLSPDQIGERFGPAQPRLDAAIAWLARHGIDVTKEFSQRTSILARAPARVVESLLDVHLNQFRTRDHTIVRLPSRPPRIPVALDDVVAHIDGLDTRPVSQPRSAHEATARARSNALTPEQLRGVYDANTLVAGGIDGAGETVAIVSLATVHGEEFQAWTNRFGLNPEPVETITVPPAPPGPEDPEWDESDAVEVDLDLDMVRAMAPGATILNYTTRNDGPAIERAIDQIVEDQQAKIATISWGACELRGVSRSANASYLAAQAAGIDIYVASGDNGPYDCNPPDETCNGNRELAVDFPSSSPYVTAVGGTTLFVDADHRYGHEDAWQEPVGMCGAGGGTSVLFDRPAWQLDSVVHEPGDRKLVPDVAGPASSYTNLEEVVWHDGRFYTLVIGGTSAAAPFWAGLTALAKQYVRQRVGRVVADGDLKSLMYEIASQPGQYADVFHDVTTGKNQEFAARPGWDFITGLGTPKITQLARTWETLTRTAPTNPTGRIEGPRQCQVGHPGCTFVAVVRNAQSGTWSSTCEPSGPWPENHYYVLNPNTSEAGTACTIQLQVTGPSGDQAVLEHSVAFVP